MAKVHQDFILGKLAPLMDNTRYSDLTITCQGREFKVHKAIVCSASDVLAAEVDKAWTESATGVIEHTYLDVDTVERMISYLYRQDYDVNDKFFDVSILDMSISEPAEDVESSDSRIPQSISGKLVTHVRAYAIADYYALPTLKLLAVDKFVADAKSEWSVEGFEHVITAVDTLTSRDDKDMREALRATAMDHLTELTMNDAFMVKLTELQGLQDFAAALLRQVVCNQIAEKALHVDQLKAKEEELQSKTTELSDTVTGLRIELAKEERSHGHADYVMADLVSKIEGLREECANANCNKVFGSMSLERKGSAQFGPGEGDWIVRCSRCRCNLTK